ncbi:MAG: ABC transporter permease subunit [Myxococcales bacterium]|nr:ABC transporter permease subunit [Myxococcales bacterium]
MCTGRRALLAILLLGALAATGCHRRELGGTLARIEKAHQLTYGADLQGGEPYLWLDDDGALVGFEVEIMDAVARRLGVKAKMRHFNWVNLVPLLRRGDFDVVCNGLEAAPARAAGILLSRPYFVYAETLAVRTGAPYRALADLRGKRVATLDQTYALELLRGAGVEIGLYEDNQVIYDDLALGRVDAVLLDNVIADRYGCDHAGVTCLPDDVARGSYVIGIRRQDPELKVAIDGALAAMAADGELERILRKAGLWDHRQTDPAPAAADGPPPPRRTFGWVQLRRFGAAALVTLGLSVAAFALAVPLGLLLAIGRVYGGRVLGAAARVYIELFRGTPVLLQLYVIYFALAPYYAIGPITAAILTLGLNYGAYEAEVYRGAILAIPRGQAEAAKALGLSPMDSLRHVIVPQALRLALPPMTNDFVSLLKDSSLVSVITVIELTKQMTISAAELQGWLVPGLACAALYLALSVPLSELARRLERRLARDQRAHAL